MSDGKFLFDLVVEVVRLPILVFSAMSNGKFLADLVMVVLSIKMSGLALLKP